LLREAENAVLFAKARLEFTGVFADRSGIYYPRSIHDAEEIGAALEAGGESRNWSTRRT
jgi:hypothetical protein